MNMQAQPALPEWVYVVQQVIDNIKSIPQMKDQIAASEIHRQRQENEYRQYKLDLEEKARLQQRADTAERKKVMDKLDALIGTVNSMKGEIAELASMKDDVAAIKGDVAGMKGDIAGIKDDVAGIRGDIAGIKVDIAGLSEAADEEAIRRSNKAIGLVNKSQQSIDWTPLRAVKGLGDVLQGYEVDIKRFADINNALK